MTAFLLIFQSTRDAILASLMPVGISTAQVYAIHRLLKQNIREVTLTIFVHQSKLPKFREWSDRFKKKV